MKPRRFLNTCLLLASLASAASGIPAGTAATLRVGAGESIRSVAEASRVAKDGDVVEIVSGEYSGDVAVWTQKHLTIRGVGPTRPVVRAGGRSAEGKAIWVVRDGEFLVENVAFEGARVDDRNGAGIRFERGRLTVRHCRFTDNEVGLMTANVPDTELTIEASEFSHAPRDRGPLMHLLYVGRIARFAMTGSRFHDGFEGHLVKSRARENYIAYNLLYDGAGGMASYELEFPNAGVAYVIGNVIGQSATTTNPVVIAYGAEGATWDANALYLANNTLVSERTTGAWFLRVWSDRIPADCKIVAVDNLTVGLGIFALGIRGRFEANFPMLPGVLADPSTLDFRLGRHSLLRGAGVPPPTVGGRSLAPEAEFDLPIGTRPLAPPETWTPGAFQTSDPAR